MKTLKTIAALAAVCLLAGCASLGGNLASFVANLPANTVTDATQTTTTPVYTHSESVTNMSKAQDGTINVSNAKATASIPEIGVSWGISVSGLTIQPKQAANDTPAPVTLKK